MMMSDNTVKSLYIHVPFCSTICHYCDFCKVLYYKPWVALYLERLKEEIQNTVETGELDTIYIGGGTPSVLDERELKELLEIVKPYSAYVKEYTMEINPETLTKEKVMLLKNYGINRASLGVQSFNESIVKRMNRQHHNQDVFNCISLLREVGIDNISIDLIYGIEGMTKEMITDDVKFVVNLNIPHISYYSLLLEEHTVFHLTKMSELSQEESSHYYSYIVDQLKKHGYHHYEVSNFAYQNFESKHNLVYWKNEQYYGVGCGASGYVGSMRYTNTKSINQYLKGKTVFEKTELSKDDQAFETLMLGLRMTKGISIKDFVKTYGNNRFQKILPIIEKYYNNHLLVEESGYLKTTDKGMLLLDSILVEFLERLL